MNAFTKAIFIIGLGIPIGLVQCEHTIICHIPDGDTTVDVDDVPAILKEIKNQGFKPDHFCQKLPLLSGENANNTRDCTF